MVNLIYDPIHRVILPSKEQQRKVEETKLFKQNKDPNVKFFNLSSQIDDHESSEDNVLNLESLEEKAIIQVSNNFFTFLFQELSSIMFFYSRIKNRKEVKLYIHLIKDKLDKNNNSLFIFLLKYLTDCGIVFELIDSEKYNYIKINNFYMLQSGFSPNAIRSIYAKTKKYITHKDVEPFRKVFVSRKPPLPERISNTKTMEDFFKSVGFEVIYPEDFENFVEQINYFSQCKVIAGVSGSALSNCIFMKPGGTVLEISSLFINGSIEFPVEIHDFYRIMAMCKEHLYFSIFSISRNFNKIMKDRKTINFIKMI